MGVSKLMISLFLLTSLCTCGRAPKVLKLNGVAVYQSLNAGARAEKQLNELGVGQILLLDGRHLHSDDGMSFAPEKLEPYLNKVMPPGKKDARMIVLDWEGKRMRQIFNGAKLRTEAYEAAKSEMLAALDFVKKARPRAKVGFYGFPERNYWKRDEDWKSGNTALIDFLSETDALFPSLYDFYVTTDKNRKAELAYVRDNMKEALRLGKELNKPVYPFVWHRYHDSNKEVGKELIPSEEFAEHIKALVSSAYKEKKIEGIIWWSSERYFYNLSHVKNKNQADFEERVGRVSSEYLGVIMNILRDE